MAQSNLAQIQNVNVTPAKQNRPQRPLAANDNQKVTSLRAPGSPRTVDEVFSDRYTDPFAESEAKEKAANDNRSNSKRDYGSTLPTQTPQTQSATAETVAETFRAVQTARAAAASLEIYIVCSGLFVIQLSFWLLAMVGLGLEVGALSLGDLLGLNMAQRLVADLSGALIPGVTFFFIGTIIATLYGLMQLGIAVSLFYAAKINPFKGNSQVTFMAMAAIYFLPFIGGIFPWGIFWLRDVVNETRHA